MYKDSSGQRKFSFTRFMTNAIPNIAGASQDTDLDIREQDMLFLHQLEQPDPLILSPLSFQACAITSSPKTSTSIHRALLKNGILSAESSTVNTSKITRNFAHELSIITSHAQKKLVNMLFFWEEELQRWKVLIAEQQELRVVIAAEKETGGQIGSYEKRLIEVEGLLRVRPSLRAETAKERLPAYVEGKKDDTCVIR